MNAKTQLFWSKVDKRLAGDCWVWTGCKNQHGYGKFAINGGWVLAHRYAIGAEVGQTVLHSCDNPACCNPAHLRFGTPAENVADMVERGRHRALSGSANGRAKLNELQVQRIRIVGNALSKRRLAQIYGVSDVLIGKIQRGELWGSQIINQGL